jgi:hypothetical protein
VVACDPRQVLLFDTVGSTYLCILGEGNRSVQEFFRVHGEDPWLRVERGDKTKADIYQDAGVPKTIPWHGPTMVVYTHGKLDVCKGGAVCKSTRKFYQVARGNRQTQALDRLRACARLHACNSLSEFCTLGSKHGAAICRSGVECAAKPAVATHLRVRCLLHACLALLRPSVHPRDSRAHA